MGDEGFDPCECVWGHEMAMRRLISLLRQSQSYCTDSECFQDVIANRNQTPDNNFMIMSLFLAFALLMYFLRPQSQRNTMFDSPSKPGNGDSGFNGPPPNPPTAS